MLEAAEDPSSTMRPAIRRNLLADPAYPLRARRVVTAVPKLALPSLERRPVDWDAVEDLTGRLALGGALKRLAETLSAVGVEQVEG